MPRSLTRPKKKSFYAYRRGRVHKANIWQSHTQTRKYSVTPSCLACLPQKWSSPRSRSLKLPTIISTSAFMAWTLQS